MKFILFVLFLLLISCGDFLENDNYLTIKITNDATETIFSAFYQLNNINGYIPVWNGRLKFDDTSKDIKIDYIYKSGDTVNIKIITKSIGQEHENYCKDIKLRERGIKIRVTYDYDLALMKYRIFCKH